MQSVLYNFNNIIASLLDDQYLHLAEPIETFNADQAENGSSVRIAVPDMREALCVTDLTIEGAMRYDFYFLFRLAFGS